jgi:FkbM family methyltransferase
MPNILDDYTISYAQNREDIVLGAFFSDVDKGVYVDVGANHPLYHSVTKRFYDAGWRGINYEPNPKLYEQMAEHRKKDVNVMQGLGESPGELELRVFHSRDGLEGISTFSESMKQDYTSRTTEDSKDYSDIRVPVVTLAESLESLHVSHIHFLKVDVEGYEYEVLSGNDWKKFRPELVCIESNHMMRDWRPILEEADYKKVFNDGLNDYYLAKEAGERAKNFDYAEVFLLGKPVISFETSEKLRVLEQNYGDAKKLLKEREVQLAEISNFLNEITPLSKHLKRQVKARLHKG